jgi:hypothetical protein
MLQQSTSASSDKQHDQQIGMDAMAAAAEKKAHDEATNQQKRKFVPSSSAASVSSVSVAAASAFGEIDIDDEYTTSAIESAPKRRALESDNDFIPTQRAVPAAVFGGLTGSDDK